MSEYNVKETEMGMRNTPGSAPADSTPVDPAPADSTPIDPVSADSAYINLYTVQTETVLDVIERDGAAFSKPEYVQKKYGESAPVFLTAYSWYAAHAAAIVPKPAGADFPYWAFADPKNADGSGGGIRVCLRVPKEEAVFFDMRDWGQILKLSYLGETEREERCFTEELSARGLYTGQVMTSSFYPEWKAQILESWERLFRHHKAILSGNTDGVFGVQAGLWCIRKEWIY